MLTKSDIISVPQDADLPVKIRRKLKNRSRKKKSESGEIATTAKTDSKEKESVEKLTKRKLEGSHQNPVGDDKKSGKAEKKEKPF